VLKAVEIELELVASCCFAAAVTWGSSHIVLVVGSLLLPAPVSSGFASCRCSRQW
jgi:hypothetical protein